MKFLESYSTDERSSESLRRGVKIYGGLTVKNKAGFENGNANYIPYKINYIFYLDANYNSPESVKFLIFEIDVSS